MTDYGVTPTGFVLKPQSVILQEIEQDQRANISGLIDVSADTPIGQMNGIYSQRLAALWELAQDVYNSFDPDSAEDASLDNLGKLRGTDRQGASYSLVTCSCNVDNGVTLLSGTNFASVAGNPSVRFTPDADFTATSDGTHDVVFRAENTGAIEADAGTLSVIATPVVGWNSVTNALDADVGSDVQSDGDYRLSQETGLAERGSSTTDAIRSHLLDDLDFVQTCTVFENTGDTPDGNGLPGHSLEALIYDGDSPPPTNNDAIAQVIWNFRPGGIRPVGNTSGNAVDKLGITRAVPFSRAVATPIYISYTLSTGPGYIGAAAVAAAVASACNAQFKEAGQTVIALFVRALPLAQLGVLDVTAFAIGTAPSPSAASNIAIGTFGIARFDTSRISVTP
jgi:hypothetical protein